jgi:hypothetical protein
MHCGLDEFHLAPGRGTHCLAPPALAGPAHRPLHALVSPSSFGSAGEEKDTRRLRTRDCEPSPPPRPCPVQDIADRLRPAHQPINV